MKPTSEGAYRLVHEGLLALSEVEHAGMRIDVARLDKAIVDVAESVRGLEAGLKSDPLWAKWRRRFSNPSLDSRNQLGIVLVEEEGYEPTSYTSGGKTGKRRAKMDEDELEKVGLPFVKDFLRMQKLKKLGGTYLDGIRREVVGDMLRPSENLHLARTHRSSIDKPSFQNIPIRDPEIGKIVRSCFIPRDGHVLVERDYSGHEFKVAACFWRDPGMIAYASDPSLDIHRDMAEKCYMLGEGVPKTARFFAKNQFVFPTLYGSWWKNTARNLWTVIDTAGLKTQDGTPMKEHLRSRGIRELGDCKPRSRPAKGTYERHVMEAEEEFFDTFPTLKERQESWWKKYQETGEFRMMTGFLCTGLFSKNNLFNTPIQGPAFHLLLWSLIQMVRWVKKGRRRTRIIGQIHDSILGDVHRDELGDYLQESKRVMTEDVAEAWPWVIVPLQVEAEVAETNWFEKKKVDG